MEIKIIKKEEGLRGIVYHFETEAGIIKVLFLHHGMKRMRKWNLTEEMLAETLFYPEEVLIGHVNRFIAHRRYGNHIVRAVYEYEDKLPVLVTVYFPRVEKYFKGGGRYENKILF